VWSPDIAGPLNFSIAVTGPATRFSPWVSPSPNPPDTSIVAGHPFSVSVGTFDDDWNFTSHFSGDVTIALADNPAGAHLGGTLTVTAANGVATFSDLTLDQPGTGYTLQISSDGLATATTVPFDVQTTIDTVGVGWGTSGSATLQTASDGLRLLPAGRATDLPWLGIQQVRVNLAQAATLTASDITVLGAGIDGASGINYGPVTITGSGTSYTITLARPISSADRVTITIGNPLIAGYTRRLDILPGDVNDDGVVNSQDMVLIRNAIQKTGDPLMIGWADVDGDGSVVLSDYIAARKKLGSHLP
jgi:hypothetical protein